MTAESVVPKYIPSLFPRVEAMNHFQHILKKEVTLDAEPYATIPAGTPIFGEEQGHFIVFQFGEYKRQIPKTHF